MQRSAMEFEDKVVLVTGAAGGIGNAIAKRFAELGAKLSLADIDETGLENVAEECRKLSSKVEVYIRKTEARDVKQLKALVRATVETFGKIDVLVNNAGMMLPGNVSNTPEEHYDLQMDVNIKSAFYLTQEALPELVKTKGSVINTSSIGSIAISDYCTTYCISKSALDAFTKCVAKELASQGVRVNSINPGNVDTKFMKPVSQYK